MQDHLVLMFKSYHNVHLSYHSVIRTHDVRLSYHSGIGTFVKYYTVIGTFVKHIKLISGRSFTLSQCVQGFL